MTVKKLMDPLDTNDTLYHRVHPDCADFDLSIFKSICEGMPVDKAASEHACNITSISASLKRLGDFLSTGDLFSIAEIFRRIYYNSTLDRPTPSTMVSVIDTLYHAASKNGIVTDKESEEHFSRLSALTAEMPPKIVDGIFDTVNKICDVFEYACFTEGVKVGFQLGKELSP